MSLTIFGRNSVISLSSIMPPPPCTLEIKFSTQGSSDPYKRNQLIIGGIQRNTSDNKFNIAWGIMIKDHYGDGRKYIKAKINNDRIYDLDYDGFYKGGQVINDGDPHTIRLCINTDSVASIYEDGKRIIRGRWEVKSHRDDNDINDIGIFIGGCYNLPDNCVNVPTTVYYVKFAKKCIIDSYINKSDCSDYYTWNSDGYRVLNGVPVQRESGTCVCDDITLDYIRHSAYKHDLDLYGIKK